MANASSHKAWLLALVLGGLLGACGRHHNASPTPTQARVDSLNTLAYRAHYRDIKRVSDWAEEAYALADSIHYQAGVAEALNHMAFERFQQMDFDSAQALASDIIAAHDDDVECLVADVMLMKVAQRTSDNLAFFRHRSHALQRIRRLEGRQGSMDEHRHRRYDFACGELHIVASTYFYYLDQQERAIDEIRQAEPYCRLQEDTAQWLYYNYMRGSGGLSDHTAPSAVAREEFDYLLPCFWMARREGYLFFEANTAQSFATLLTDSLRLQAVSDAQPEVVAVLAHLFAPDATTTATATKGAVAYDIATPTLVLQPRIAAPMATAMQMAEKAYELFLAYDDLYQQACVLRTLGELSFEDGRYDDAIDYYAQALSCVNFHHQCYYASDALLSASPPAAPSSDDLLMVYDARPVPESVERRWMRLPEVKTVPEWIAGIRQQLSVAYSALDMKAESDYNRNIYLDLLDVTREDAEFESRAAELQYERRRLTWTWAAVVLVALLISAFILLLMHNWRQRTRSQRRLLNQKIQQVKNAARQHQEALEEEQELLREQQAVTEQRLLRDKEQNIEKHAKWQLVTAIQPLLNRIIHAVQRMQQRNEISAEALDYISALTERIIDYNRLLTQWIQMQQGQLALQLSSFPLEELFGTLRRGHYAYDQKGLTLDVATTDLCVKADRALTLFMLNTLADNARKFTPQGGRVTITATAGEDDNGGYVELAVQDTGCGISETDINLILNHKVYDAGKIGRNTSPDGLPPKSDVTVTEQGHDDSDGKGFGFGLMNCKGIIEKYRKTSALFAVCSIGIESKMGEGSRFWFRLPRVMTIVALCLLARPLMAMDVQQQTPMPTMAYEMADSVYFCNLHGRYADAVLFADTALSIVNEAFASDALTKDAQLVIYDPDNMASDIIWWQRHVEVDYDLLLGLRNELSVAALALHEWPLYRYNNSIYTRLYKLTNQDTTLEDYCHETEQSQQHERWAIHALIIFFLGAIVALYMFYFRPQMRFRRKLAMLNDHRLTQLQRNEEAAHARRQSDLEQAEDEHRRRLYEDNRLHVQNLIIDNVLSTIKHETMYYPGRIRQLVEQLRNDMKRPVSAVDTPSSPSSFSSSTLDTLSETVSYYSEMYELLSAQALSQPEAVNFRRHRLSFSALTADLSTRFAALLRQHAFHASLNISDMTQNAVAVCDPDLIAYLLSELISYELNLTMKAHESGSETMSLSTDIPHTMHANDKALMLTLNGSTDNRFMRLTLTNPYVRLSDTALHDFFMPHEGSIPLLICKQIIREHDAFLGHPGCRIQADGVGEGHCTWFTLPLYQASSPAASIDIQRAVVQHESPHSHQT